MKLSLLLLFSVMIFACKPEIESRVNADFSLLEKQKKQRVSQYEGAEAGGGNLLEKDLINAEGLEYKILEEKILLEVKASESTFSLVPQGIGLPASWKPFAYLEITVTNRLKSPIEMLTVLWCPRGRLPDTLKLQPGEATSFRINLLDLPLIGSVQNKYQVNEIAFNFLSDGEGSIEINQVELLKTSQAKPLAVIDQFGQRINTSWPNKVQEVADLKEDWQLEKDTLREYFSPGNFDQYYGYKGTKKYDVTGYFHIENEVAQDDTTWFFVTPEGNPFWSVGVNGVRPKKPKHAVTLVKGHEQLFQELPDRNGPYGSAYIDSTFSFYNWNILRKYENLQNWRGITYQRLQSWGVNTIGNWAEKEILLNSPVPFTYSFESGFRQFKKDVYDPAWTNHVDSVLSEATDFKNNKKLIGYFVDNESGWGNLALFKTLPENAYLRKEWLQQMKQKYGDLSMANRQWNNRFTSWQAAMNCSDATMLNELDVKIMGELYAHQYFKIITQSLKKYDPNHLYLGCRFTRRLKPLHLLKIAGHYCDAVTVNVYSYQPEEEQMGAWYRATGKPILIGEHHVALKGPRQLPLRWQVFTEEERHEYYTNYISTWARQPYSLGCHWYQYSDQHLTGRASNGENQLVGLVDITDQPHLELISALRKISADVYKIHF